MKLFFLTRTYPDDKTGGALIRKGQIEHFRKYGYDVWIIAPNYLDKRIIYNQGEKCILYPLRIGIRCTILLEALGFCDDYLSNWAKNAAKYLQQYICADDIIFATSGGELGTLSLGAILKNKIGCKLIYNLHDPIGFTHVNGYFLKYYSIFSFHIPRDRIVKRYLLQADAVITSSISYMTFLNSKYNIKNIHACYFGYLTESNLHLQKKVDDIVHIVYGGALSQLQHVDLFIKYAIKNPHIKISVIGNYLQKKNLLIYQDKVAFLHSMPQDEYLTYLSLNADIGFLSLDGPLSDLCIPSKLFEYINLGIPILAIIKGDTARIVEEYEYGVIATFSESSIQNALQLVANNDNRKKWKSNILRDRERWSMDFRIKEFINIINKITSK